MLQRKRVVFSRTKHLALHRIVALDRNDRDSCMWPGLSVTVVDLKKMGPGYVGKVVGCPNCRRPDACAKSNSALIIIPTKKKLDETKELKVTLKRISAVDCYGVIKEDKYGIEDALENILNLRTTVTGRINFTTTINTPWAGNDTNA